MPSARRLVIDTNITSAAGDADNKDYQAKTCHDCLIAVRNAGRSFVLSPDILEEWNRHRSKFALQWLTTMQARKLVIRLGDVRNPALRAKILKHVEGEKAQREVEKDFRLLEAALATDRLILSRNSDDKDRFVVAAIHVSEIKPIVWVNPFNENDKCLEWLEGGCPADRERQLGYRGDDDAS